MPKPTTTWYTMACWNPQDSHPYLKRKNERGVNGVGTRKGKEGTLWLQCKNKTKKQTKTTKEKNINNLIENF